MVVSSKPQPFDLSESEKEEFPNAKHDEGWWESVLAEESQYSNGNHAQAPALEVTDTRKTPQVDTVEDLPPLDWELAETIYKQDQIINLNVMGYNRGGLLVKNDRLHGFVPYSHLVDMTCQTDAERENFLAEFVGKELRLKVIEFVPEEGRVVFSERAARADAGKRTELFSALHTGEITSGEVTNITDFGAFIDLGGVEGLIHISELSWCRVIHPSYILKLGQIVNVKVIDILPERCRIALSLKRLQANPWDNIQSRYAIGDIVPAIISSVVSFGVFARLEEGLEGLVHISEIKLNGASVRETFSEGQKITVRILHMEPEHQRLGLSLKLDNK